MKTKAFAFQLTVTFLVSGALFSAGSCFAQSASAKANNDAQLWENLNVNKKLTQNFTLRFSHEGRFTQNDSRLTYYFGDFGAEYEIPKTHFGILLDYVFIRKELPEYWSTRHQFYTALTYGKKFGKFSVHDRQMFLGQVKDVNTSIDGRYPEWYVRNKLTLKYKFNFFWSAYVAEELYWHINIPRPDALPHFNRVRYFAGLFFKPDNHNEFEVYYLIEQHMNTTAPPHNFVLGVGYELSL
ncbi:MAG TPA: DUF2490 domain-containing protein [Bacteroidia bacterium]|nr:DUF2490 domain-containing protein [Bacteroidia bacterium]